MIATNLQNVQVWVATTPVDMRKSFDSLAEVVKNFLGHDPLSGNLFVFRNKGGHLAKSPVVGPRWSHHLLQAIGKRRIPDFLVATRPRWKSTPSSCSVYSLARVPCPAQESPEHFSRTRLASFYDSCVTTAGMTVMPRMNYLNDVAALKQLVADQQQVIDRIRGEAARQLEAERAARQAAIDEAVKAAVRRDSASLLWSLAVRSSIRDNCCCSGSASTVLISTLDEHCRRSWRTTRHPSHQES